MRRTHLDDQVALGVPGHPAELGRQLLELRPAVRVDHPACGEERRMEKMEQRRGSTGKQ